MPTTTSKWDSNTIQFARLLCEIAATQDLDMKTLAESMDLTLDQVNKLFDRANTEWEAIKQASIPVPVADDIPAGEEGDLVTLAGEPVLGTSETLLATNDLRSATRQPDGTLSLHYGDAIRIHWDTAQQQTDIAGVGVYITRSGAIVPESQVKLVPKTNPS